MKRTVRTHFFTAIFATTNMIASGQQKIDNPFDLYREGHYYYYRTHAHPNSTLTTGTEEKELFLIECVTHKPIMFPSMWIRLQKSSTNSLVNTYKHYKSIQTKNDENINQLFPIHDGSSTIW